MKEYIPKYKKMQNVRTTGIRILYYSEMKCSVFLEQYYIYKICYNIFYINEEKSV